MLSKGDRNDSPFDVLRNARRSVLKTFMAGLVAVSFIIAGAPDALAYIDPNTGGYVFQLLFPIISIIAFAYLFLKRQVKLLFGKIGFIFKKVFEKIFSALGISRGDISKGSD